MKFNFNLPVTFLKEGDKFVAYSPAIDVSTSADSYEEVQKRFVEAAILFFEEIVKKNTINKALEELGWQKIKSNWMPPVVIGQENQKVAISVG